MSRKKSGFLIMALVITGCIVMAWIEGTVRPIYQVKSACKWLVFGGCILIYALVTRDNPLFCLKKPGKATLKGAILLFIGVVVVILGGYALLNPWLDLSAITGNLGGKEGITAATFPIVALYISICNSFLEELFFRGFAFLALKKAGFPKCAWGFSALTFALYHVAIMDSWFTPPLFLLLTASLVVAGLLFDWLDSEGTIYPSWLVHMGANIAINTIGMRLFGLL